MNKKIICIGIVGMFLLTSMIAMSVVGMQAGVTTERQTEENTILKPMVSTFDEEYTERGSIYIGGDNRFTEENGVTGGSGTEQDPYIIEGWKLPEIDIDGTTAHFIIRNCYLHGTWLLWLTNVQNGKVENCILRNNGDWGLNMDRCSDCTILNCTIYFCSWAIMMQNSHDNIFHHNTIYGATWGFCMDHSETKDNVFHHNDILYTSPWAVAATEIGSNQWDDGSEGNYWHYHYEGKDRNGNGIGDTPYRIDFLKNKDRYPLMKPVRSPDAPTINGPTKAAPETELIYTVSAIEPQGEDVYYTVLWGDEPEDYQNEWIGPYPSGQEVTITHTYQEKGNYQILFAAMDTNNLPGPWGTLPVSMPRNRAINTPIFNFLQQHPIMLQLLQRFLKI